MINKLKMFYISSRSDSNYFVCTVFSFALLSLLFTRKPLCKCIQTPRPVYKQVATEMLYELTLGYSLQATYS